MQEAIRLTAVLSPVVDNADSEEPAADGPSDTAGSCSLAPGWIWF